jgi:hypothetical protein
VVWRHGNSGAGFRIANEELRNAIRNSGVSSTGRRIHHDITAIEGARKAQRQRAEERETYQPGKWTQARDVLNPAAAIGLGADSLAASGVDRQTIEGGLGAAGAASGEHAFEEMVKGLWGGMPVSESGGHMSRTAGMGVRQMFASFVPILSNVASGAKMLVAWGKTGMSLYRKYSTGGHSGYLSGAQDIEAAFQGMQQVLQRELNAALRDAAVQTADFFLRTASSFVDFGVSGSLTGVVTSSAKLTHKIYLLGREYSETRPANGIMMNPDNLNTGVFDVYPLLGCYMIVCSDMSLISLVRFPDQAVSSSQQATSVRFGSMGWMEDVERIAAGHIGPLREIAARSIRISPFVIDNMPLHVISQPNFLTKAAQFVSKAETLLTGGKGVLRAT